MKVCPDGGKCFGHLDGLNSAGLVLELEFKTLHVSWAAEGQRLQHLHSQASRELP